MYEYQAIVAKVQDGDTVYLDVDQGFREWHHDMSIRMAGINAPELKLKDPVTGAYIKDAAGHTVDNPLGIAARDFLMDKLPVGQLVILHSLKDKADKYGGRWDGIIFVDNVNINELMIQSGHAVPYLI